MSLKYTSEVVEHNGTSYYVLDVDNIDFSDAKIGRKKKPTKVYKATGGEEIITIVDGNEESTYIAQEGDAVFVNSASDRYVPIDNDNNRLKFCDLESSGYRVIGYPLLDDELIKAGATKDSFICSVESTVEYKVLPNVIVLPTCIKDAFGKGQHQFLIEGASLKCGLEDGFVTGIAESAFSEGWEIYAPEIISTK